MHSKNDQPFIESRAYNKANKSYVTFPSQTDAMLASLQLFHDVPCRIMDLVLSVVTHPDFDSKQATLRNSVDVINVVEESRLKDRMAVVHERSVNKDGCAQQAGFPYFVLCEVLDIIHAKRMDDIMVHFEADLDDEAMYLNTIEIEEDEDLKAMSCVHRSWTIPAQNVLGRVLHIGKPSHEMSVLHSPVKKSIFGPWTSVVAIQLFQPFEEHEEHHYDGNDGEESVEVWYTGIKDVREDYRQWFETLHRILVGFVNLKSIYIKSYASFLTEWSNFTIREMLRQNTRLEEVMLYASREQASDCPFNLDYLIENDWTIGNLRNLKTQGANFSENIRENGLDEVRFTNLRELTIKKCRLLRTDPADLVLFSVLSKHPNPGLDLTLYGMSDSDLRQCGASFYGVHTLYIGSWLTKKWLELIVPHCSTLKDLTLSIRISTPADLLDFIPNTVQSLDIRILTPWRDSRRDDTIVREKGLQKLISSGHLSELKSICISFSDDYTQLEYESDNRNIDKAQEAIQEFHKEMRVICVIAGVKYDSKILRQFGLPYSLRFIL